MKKTKNITKTTKLLIFFLIFYSLCSCGKSKLEKAEFNQLKIQVKEQDMQIQLLSKKVSDLLLINTKYEKYLSSTNSNQCGITDIYHTEIILDGFFNPTLGISQDYNIAIVEIKNNNFSESIKILKLVKQNLQNAIQKELELQDAALAQAKLKEDNDLTSSEKEKSQTLESQQKIELSNPPILKKSKISNSIFKQKQINTNKEIAFDKQRLDFFYSSLFEVNYLLGYLTYALKDYKSAIEFFIENYNLPEEAIKPIPQEKMFNNVFALMYSFYKINRSDKYCEIANLTNITNKSFYSDKVLYTKIISSLPTVDCK